MKEEKINPFEMAKGQIDIAAKYLNLDPGLLEKLKHTKRELIVHFPVKTDNGWLKPQNSEESIHRQMIIAKFALQIAN
jgi:glutamate dehydrogenase/leucine dehydrogenase